MPKYRARVDCLLSPPSDTETFNSFAGITSRLAGEYFVNLVNHISSSGADLGIEMIAANFGINGGGLDFWDSSTPAGRRAWACFRFHSASLGKFDCLVFQQTGSLNIAYGSTVAINGNTVVPNNTTFGQNYYLGISFASHPSGSNVTQTDGPWNGTYSLTSASIGNPIWKVNSQGKGAFFPRNNGILGVTSASRGWLAPLFDTSVNGTFDPQPTLLHVITSEDSLTILHDMENNGTHKVMHFGSFLPRSGTNCESPYFMYVNESNDTPRVFPIWDERFGHTGSISIGGNVPDGGIAHPDLSSGSMVSIGNSLYMDNLLGYNIFINSGSYEIMPGWACAQDTEHYGILGIYNHIKLGWGMNNKTVSAASSSAAFGRDVLNERKLIVPWKGVPPGGTFGGRTGRNFSIG